MWPLESLGGHLGSTVSALVDGQLDDETADAAWVHVHQCPQCRRLVERESWLKRQLSAMGPVADQPPSRLLGSLYDLAPPSQSAADEAVDAWAAVHTLERQGRGRRRVGIALVGAGSVGAAVLGLTALGGAPLSGPAGAPAASLTRASSPATPTSRPTGGIPGPATTASVRGPLPGWTVRRDASGIETVGAADRP